MCCAELGALLEHPLLTLERVRVCKRDGRRLASPQELPSSDANGLGVWQKLTLSPREQARHRRHPLHVELIQRLRSEGAAGATALRGVWGFHGDHAPHGDRLLSLRRHVPVVTAIVDTPERCARWFALIDELTPHTGLVTSEVVPASRASGPDLLEGGLRLAERLTT